MMSRETLTIRFGQWLAILAVTIFLFVLATCGGGGGGGGGGQDKVTITGVVEDGSNHLVPNASCSFVDIDGHTLASDDCDQNGIYQLQVPSEEIGYIYCGPKNMRSLNLSTVVSTVGVAVGETLQGENVTPTTTVAADIIRYENPADLDTRKSQLILQAQTDPNLQLVAAMAGRLFRAMLANNVDARFGDDRSSGDGGGGGEGRGDAGGVGGDAGDGADFSPLAEARCSFIISDNLASGEALYPAAMADFLADGELDRPDLAGLADEVLEGLSATTEEIRQAFETWFPNGLGEILTDVADENGKYFLPIPSNLEGYVSCVPKDRQKLILGTHIAGRSAGQVLDNQDINPATTVFSKLVAPQLKQDLGTTKENFIADIEGLETQLVFENGNLTGFQVNPETTPADSDVGLVAFSATALFNTFYKNNLDIDFLAAIDDLVDDQTVDADFLASQGIPADQTQPLAKMINDSVAKAETHLGTHLAEALSKARINVTVMGAQEGAGLIAGALIDIENEDVTCTQGCGQETNAQGQLTLTLSDIPESPATQITVIVSSVEGYAPYSVTTDVVAFATVDLDVTLPAINYNLVVQGSGDGEGHVTSSPAGIDCAIGSGSADNCSASYASGAQVTLMATPAAGSAFDDWDGVCSGAGPSCTVTVNENLTLTASFTSQCSEEDIHIGSDEAIFGADGGEGSFSVTAPDDCPWSASTTAPAWITIDSGGSGNGTVNYTVAANETTSQRIGTITVGQHTHTVTQGPLNCTVSISPDERNFTRDSGSGSITVTVAEGCPWTASTTDNWLSIVSGGSGNGNGTVNYAVAANSDSPQRDGSISVGGVAHTVHQAEALIPPTPDPMTWATEPHETSTTAIAMTATTATDPDTPVTYLFDFVDSPTGGTGGTDSGWQSGTTYTDSGLGVNQRYGYRVQARDGDDNRTGWSSTSYDYTDIETPSGITFGTITTTSIQARSTNTPSGLTRGSSGLIIYNVTRESDSGWRQNNNYWTSGSLAVNYSYGFRAQARNGDSNATAQSDAEYRYTLANAPGYSQFSNITRTSIRANWTANGNPAGTQYRCHNTTTDEYSAWTTNTYWVDSGLTCDSAYAFRVQARNGDNTVTAWTSLGSGGTLACLPVVTVSVVDSSAAEAQEFVDNGTYRISRTGSTASRLTVYISMSGTATNATDYQTISSPVYIAAGSNYVDVSLRPQNDYTDEPNETAQLTINTNGAYTRGSPYSATITILDDDRSELIGCDPTTTELGDFFDRGFYVTNYPGTNISYVTMYFGTHVPGSYTLRLTARAGSYSGSVIGTTTYTRTLGETTVPVYFSFSGSPAVSQGSTVTFAIGIVSGPSSTSVYYNVDTAGGCPVIQTNGTTPPLDSIRRYGIAVNIYGDLY